MPLSWGFSDHSPSVVTSWSHWLPFWALAASASAAANAPAAASSWPGSTCEYSVSVTVGLAWPMRWLTSFGLAPEAKLVGSGLPTLLNTSC